MIEVPLKLFPLRPNVSGEPTAASVGEMLTSTGTGFCGKMREIDGSAGGGETPPPGGGFCTVILNVNGVTTANTPPFVLTDEMPVMSKRLSASAPERSAFSWYGETYVVGRGFPFTSATEAGT